MAVQFPHSPDLPPTHDPHELAQAGPGVSWRLPGEAKWDAVNSKEK